MMQAASDIYLGWTKGLDVNRHFYWRQLRDVKGSALVEGMTPLGLTFYAASADGPWHAPTPAPATRSPLLPTSATAKNSTPRSPTSPNAMPTRTRRTISSLSTRSGPDGPKPLKASKRPEADDG
jgi:hypothetical protein